MSTKEVRFRGKEHATLHDAFVELNFSGDYVIRIGNDRRWFTVDREELHRMECAGVSPTTWHIHEETGRIISVPGKH